MSGPIDISGQRFNFVVALRRVGTRNKRALWEWRCDCGKTGVSTISILTTGQRMSCGCKKSSQCRLRTHGLSKLPEHSVWKGMRSRCLNPTDKKYPSYGGRGIYICPEWSDFAKFIEDMGPRPTPSMQLGRIDNDGPYAPWNCRWETSRQNGNNTRRNVFYDYQGKSQTLADWCRELKLEYHFVFDRVSRLGWSFERAVETPLLYSQRNGERREWLKTLAERNRKPREPLAA